MKDLGDLLAEQYKLDRKPQSRLVFRDMMLRLDPSWTTEAYSTGYPSLTDGDLPQCPIDMNMHYDINIWYATQAWCVSDSIIRRIVVSNPHFASRWADSAIVHDYTTDGVHRPAVRDWNMYYAYYDALGGTRRIRTPGGVYRHNAYTCDTDHLALAAVEDSSTSTGDGLYMAVFHQRGTLKYITLHYVTNTETIDCPRPIIVDGEYDTPSLQWFDAETIDGYDVIIVNTRTYGLPAVIRRSPDNVWSSPQLIMPIDELSANSFLRISHLTVIEDYAGDDVLWATGRLARPGSTGSFAQSFDVALRSKDGIHWSYDRYAYLCSAEMRSKLLEDYVAAYYAGGATVMSDTKPLSMGSHYARIEREVEDDILSCTYNAAEQGMASSGSIELAAGDGRFNPADEDSDHLGRWETGSGDLAIVPGMWLWHYAGYDGEEGLLSVEGIDVTPGAYQLGDRSFSIRTRDIVMRSLYDWSADQYWEWMGQVKHYDPCTEMKYLYSVSAAQIDVKEEDDEEITTDIEETELDDEEALLTFSTPNKPAVHFCTKPTETGNFHIRARFMLTDDSGTTDVHDGYRGAGIGQQQSGANASYEESDHPYFKDTVRNWSDPWPWASLAGEEKKLAIAVTNTDGTISWGWLGAHHDDQDDEVYIKKSPLVGGEHGWNGSDVTDKTPSHYYVFRTGGCGYPVIGAGVGVCGCATDQYNLIAAMPDMRNDRIVLWIRRGDEDASAWVPWAVEDFRGGYEAQTGVIYEMEMVRRGITVMCQLFSITAATGSRMHRTNRLVANWPFDEPMVVVSDEAYNQTDRGKVGIVCAIGVPEAQIGVCRADRDWIIRNPDLFDRQITSHVWENLDSWWQQFTDGYYWTGSAWAEHDLPIPPFHFGGEKYDPAEVEPFGPSDHFGDQWDYTEAEAEQYPCNVQRWNRVRISPTNRAARYTHGWGSYMPQDEWREITWAWNRNDDFFNTEYGHATLPMFIVGDSKDLQEETISWHFGFHKFREMVDHIGNSGWGGGGQLFRLSDTELETWKRWDGWHWIMGESEHDRLDWVMPNGRIYPGFYLPGRATPGEPAQSHAKGTIIRQHWSPVLTLYGVWACDDEHDKHLEWVLKDIVAKAGVLDVDTYNSIEETGLTLPDHHSPHFLSTTLGADAYQRDFDITLELDSVLEISPHQSRMVSLIARASSNTSPIDAGSLSAIYCIVGARISVHVHSVPVVFQLWATKAGSSSWTKLGEAPVPGQVLGKTVRFVGKERAITAYVDGLQIGTLFVDTQSFPVSNDAGYLGVDCYNVSLDADVYQPELRSWTDAVPMDERQNAINAMARAIGDRRVKFVSTLDPATGQPKLRMSYGALNYGSDNIEDYPHWLGIVTDHEEGDTGWTEGAAHVSMFRDETSLTDRIPTHIRIVGYEVGDYVAHNAARRYGLLFMAHQTPHLEEAEAYEEASRVVQDAMSHSYGRKPTVAAQLHWEPEDVLRLVYTTFDGEEIEGYYVVNNVSFNYDDGPRLEAEATLRKLSWAS